MKIFIKSTGEKKEHEKYLEQVDKKNHLLFFSSLNHDGNFEDNLEDKNVDVEKVVATQMMIEALRNAMSKLNKDEREIIERLYFNDETLRAVSKTQNISHTALIKRRDKILEKLKEIYRRNIVSGYQRGQIFLYKVRGVLSSFYFKSNLNNI